jgi:hypothetical protein
MGSPVSVVIAEIVMQEMERKIFEIENRFLFWYRYVDDVISCIPKDALQEVITSINSLEDNIQFTAEVQTDN